MRYFFLLLFIGIPFLLKAQDGVNGYNPPNRMMVYNSMPPVYEKVDLQKMYMDQVWLAATVYFESGRANMEVPVIFDIDNNKLYFLQDENIMEFVDIVSGFSVLVPGKKDSTTWVFQRLYPSYQSNTNETYYQVLTDGKIQLLKCKARSIQQIKDPDLREDKKKTSEELYFAALPGDKIVLLAFDEDIVLKRMPEYAVSIKKIIKEEKIKLKSEEKMIELFKSLNKL